MSSKIGELEVTTSPQQFKLFTPPQDREILFDMLGPSASSLFSAAEMKVLELVTRCITGAFIFYFSLLRAYRELLIYSTSFTK